MNLFPRAAVALAVVASIQAAWAAGQALDSAAIESATGLKGAYNKGENVFKGSKPRDRPAPAASGAP
jgi:hypothetical protein